ncbi:MAG: HAD family phosphatase [Acidobacteria bacterium]|nr:HAD family phosphatase [Acidobacteriota bacterium]
MVALILDLDGVIINSTSTHTEAWRRYLASHGIDVPDVGQRMLGKHNDEIVREFFRDTALAEDGVRAHGSAKEALYRKIMRPEIYHRMVPGIREFLHRHRDLPMGLASNAESANVHFVLEASGLAPLFQAVIDGSRVTRPKPHPDIYLAVASALGADPACCIVFEDSPTGVQAARSAGMRVVGLATTLDVLAGVDLIMRDFLDSRLEAWLGGLLKETGLPGPQPGGGNRAREVV